MDEALKTGNDDISDCCPSKTTSCFGDEINVRSGLKHPIKTKETRRQRPIIFRNFSNFNLFTLLAPTPHSASWLHFLISPCSALFITGRIKKSSFEKKLSITG